MFDTKENIHNDIQVTAKRKLTFLEWGLGHRGEKNYETVIHTLRRGITSVGVTKLNVSQYALFFIIYYIFDIVNA